MAVTTSNTKSFIKFMNDCPQTNLTFNSRKTCLFTLNYYQLRDFLFLQKAITRAAIMEPPEQLQSLIPIADELGIALYQRISEEDAVTFLNISSESLSQLRSQGKISFIQLDNDTVEYFGYQLLEYILGAVNPATTTKKPSPSPERIIRCKDVVEKTGLSRSTLWRLEKTGNFPARVSLGAGSVGWKLSEIESWINSRR